MEVLEDLQESEKSLNLNEKIPRAPNVSLTPMNSYRLGTINLALQLSEKEISQHLENNSPIRSMDVTNRSKKKFKNAKKSVVQIESKFKKEEVKVEKLIFFPFFFSSLIFLIYIIF